MKKGKEWYTTKNQRTTALPNYKVISTKKNKNKHEVIIDPQF